MQEVVFGHFLYRTKRFMFVGTNPGRKTNFQNTEVSFLPLRKPLLASEVPNCSKHAENFSSIKEHYCDFFPALLVYIFGAKMVKPFLILKFSKMKTFHNIGGEHFNHYG